MNHNIEYFICQFEKGSTLGEILRQRLDFDEGYDIQVRRLNKNPLPSVRRIFKLPDNAEVVYYREYSSNVLLIFSSLGFAQWEDEEIAYVPWYDIKKFEYEENGEVFYLHGYNDNHVAIDSYHVTKSQSDKECGKLAEIITAFAIFKHKELDLLIDAYNNCINEGNYISAKQWAEKIEKLYVNHNDVSSCVPAYYKYNVETLMLAAKAPKPNKAKEVSLLIYNIEELLKRDNDYDFDNYKSKLNILLGTLYNIIGNLGKARRCLMRAMNTDIKEDKLEAIKRFRETDEKYCKIFLDQDYRDRKLLMPMIDVAGRDVAGIEVLDINNIPSSIQFGAGHPVENILYVGHPHIREQYIPFKGSDNELMISQYNELASILVCLGATEINIKVIKGRKIDEETKKHLNAKLFADLKLANAEGHYTSDNEKQERSDSNTAMDLTLTAKPTAFPFIPDNVIWYPQMQKWQEIAKLRLFGNTLNYVLKLSSKNASCVLDEERITIKASLSTLFGIKGGMEAEQINRSTSNSDEEEEWLIYVKFADKAEITPVSVQIDNPIAMYRFDLSLIYENGGEMTESLRRFLDKKRERLGLTKEEATEIESNIKHNFLDEI